MSVAVEAVGTAGAGVGAQSAIARIAQLQTLISQAHGAPAATPTTSNGGAGFPAALAGAGAGAGIGSTQPFVAQAVTGAPGAFGAPATALPGSAAPAGGVGGEPTPYDGLIVAAAQRSGVDPALLKGLIRAESGFDPSVTSSAGAGGLVQLMPGTAAALGVTDRFDPVQSIDAGARYLRQQLDAFGGDVTKALAAYNAGPGAVNRYGGVPPYAETQAYVQKVQAYADEYRVAPMAAPAAPAFAPTSPAGFAPTVAPATLPPTTGSGSIT